jgi:hypothetical protein
VPTLATAGWVISIICVAVAARKANVAPIELRFGKSVAVVVDSLFALFGAAYATWGIGLMVQSRQAVSGTFTTIGYSHTGLWLPMMFVLAIAIALSVVSAHAARSSWKVITTTLL